MYKGVIIEFKKDYSIILSDAQFYRVKNKSDMTVGQTIMFTDEDIFIKKSIIKQKNVYTLVGMAASFLLIFIVQYQMNISNYSAYTIMVIDINPSVELTLDKDNKVINATPLNEDAKMLGKLKLNGLSIENAFEIIITKAEEKGFIDKTQDSYVLVTNIPLKKNQLGTGEEIKSRIKERVKENIILQNINIATTETTKYIYDEAIVKNIPVGIYALKGKVDIEKYSSVKKFFKVKENIELFEETGDIISEKTKLSEQNIENNLQEQINKEEADEEKSASNKKVDNNGKEVDTKKTDTEKIKNNENKRSSKIKDDEESLSYTEDNGQTKSKGKLDSSKGGDANKKIRKD
ncbi:MAG: hypothetical protein A2Y24_03930 [Clostridiales bacterium GWE2_32_10]|nr:MAG: hypothetical protein A2Y24_03930 [Clostridiales bacterium GWE2_32_10]HBY21357.1 hypothetical protein [Clostridiales bacterium]